jgi:hypothetical protein
VTAGFRKILASGETRMAEEKPSEIRQDGGGKKVAADLADSHKPDRHMIPVWFFVGVLLLLYGVMIFMKGIFEWSNPPDTILSNLHPTFWWGILLIILGGIFTLTHRPWKKS